MIERLKRWYRGRVEITEFENDPNNYIHTMPVVTTEYHWTAKIARVFVGFYLAHWQWVWGTLLSVAALYITLLQLRQGESPKIPSATESTATTQPIETKTSNTASATNITIHEIFNTILSAPPALQQAAAENYIGAKIDWIGFLKTAELPPGRPGNLRVKINSNKDALVDYAIWFNVPAKAVPEFRSLHKQSKVRVVGQINSISIPGISVDVTPVKVEVLERSQSSQ